MTRTKRATVKALNGSGSPFFGYQADKTTQFDLIRQIGKSKVASNARKFLTSGRAAQRAAVCSRGAALLDPTYDDLVIISDQDELPFPEIVDQLAWSEFKERPHARRRLSTLAANFVYY